MKAPEFWKSDGFAARLLAPIAWLYQAATRLRGAVARPWRAPVPVICVGNLTVGGAGKTPTTIALARYLQSAGLTPHILSRGYGGRAANPIRVDTARHDAGTVGDEPLLLARQAPTWVGRDRRRTARAAVDDGADILLLDDGFQNPTILKDVSFVVVDMPDPFGNRRVFPAGPLREPITTGLRRADALVMIGRRPGPAATLTGGGLPIVDAHFVPTAGTADLRGKAVFAIAGIAKPEKFHRTLGEIGADLVGFRDFPDHHYFSDEDIMESCESAAALGAVPVTTEKDFVRLPQTARDMIRAVPVTLVFDDEVRLEEILRSAIARARAVTAN